MKNIAVFLACACLAAGAAACNNGGATLVGPDVTAVTDTFSGTVPLDGSDTFTFTTKQAGNVTFVLTADAGTTGPSIPLGFGLGTPTGIGCNVLDAYRTELQPGTTAASASATTFGSGAFCVVMTDTRSLGPASYTIQVTHF